MKRRNLKCVIELAEEGNHSGENERGVKFMTKRLVRLNKTFGDRPAWEGGRVSGWMYVRLYEFGGN